MPKTEEFKKLLKNMNETYLGKPVPKHFQEFYGKKYEKKDIRSFAFRVANSKGIQVDIKEKGGSR